MPLVRQVVTAVAHSGVNVVGIGAAGLWIGSNASRQCPQIHLFVSRNHLAFALVKAIEIAVRVLLLPVVAMQAARAKPSEPEKLNALTARQTSAEAVQTQLNHGFVGKHVPAAQ